MFPVLFVLLLVCALRSLLYFPPRIARPLAWGRWSCNSDVELIPVALPFEC